MSTELPKNYDPAAIEAATYKAWLDEKCFHAEPSDSGEPYAIVIPPPNVTGALHLGHAINNTLQDILTRKARMEGKNALWIPGLDHAGIATQAVVEKTIKEKEGKDRYSLGPTKEASREELIRRIWEWKQQYGDRILSQLQRLGCSCDWDRTRFTLDDMCAKAVRETFFKLFKDGLVYRGKRLVNWDTHLQTSISNDEIYHEKVKTNLWHIRYEIVDDASPSPRRGEGRGEGRNAPRPGNATSPSGSIAASASQSNSTPNVSPLTPTLSPRGEREPNQSLVHHGVDESDGAFLESFASDPDSEINLPNDNQPDDAPRPTHMTVATTRPETLLGDTAVAVHSQDPRWNWAIGKSVKLPLTGRLIPIIADDVLVDPTFGSGVVKVTPAHDPNDYAVYERHLKLPDAIAIINILNPDGTLNENAGPYAGLYRNKSREKVVADLEAAGLLAKVEPYETEVGHSDRSKTPVEPYLSDQWFVKMAPLAEPALEVVRDGTIKFFPERHAQQYLSWLGEKRDWPISRQLWWGHRIPVWSNRDIEKAADAHDEFDRGNSFGLVMEGVFYECFRTVPSEEQRKILIDSGFSEDPDVLDTWFSSALWPFSTLGWPEKTPAMDKWYPTSVLLTGRDIITLWVARMVMMGMYNLGNAEGRMQNAESNSAEGLANSINFGAEQYHDPIHSPKRNEAEMAGHDPQIQQPNDNDVPHPAKKSAANLRALGVPFAHVAINPTILDGKGERMSKSKGNGVDPVDIIDTHGADALRFTLSTMATETQDVRMPVKKDAEGRNTSDKFDMGRNFCNKLWNAARFLFSNLDVGRDGNRAASGDGPAGLPSRPTLPPYPKDEELTLADRWIVTRFARTLADANAAIASYRFDLYAKVCYDFFWGDYCDWYLEIIKPALKTPAGVVQLAVAFDVLDGVLRLLHPVTPFITEVIWEKLNELDPERLKCKRTSKRLCKSDWARMPPIDEQSEHIFPRLQAIIGAIRNLRSENGVDPRKPITVYIAPPGEDAVRLTKQNVGLIETMAICKVAAIQSNLPAPANTVRVTVNNDCDLYLEGLVDPAAEAARAEKRRGELTKQIAALKGRLSNEGYVAKAPPKLIQESRDQLTAAEAELAKLG